MPQASRPVFARLFSFSSLLVSLLALLIFFICIGKALLADPDIWWHLRNADLLLHNHAFLHQDTYTFTVAGKPWINPEWLSEIPYALAWRWFGYRGLEVVAITMIEAVVLGVCWLATQRTRNAKPALIAAAIFLPMLGVSFGPRTLMSGWLCLIAELSLLWAYRQGRDYLWTMPILFAIWINAHGSWPIGILFLAVFFASGLLETASWGSIEVERWTPAQRNKLALILTLSVAALFLNPYGWHLVAYPFHITLGHKVTVENVEEWQTLSFHTFRGKFTYAILTGLLLANMVRKRTWPLYELLFVLIAVLAAFTYTRFLVLAGIVVCPILAREFAFFEEPDTKNDKPILNFVMIAVLAAIAATHIPKTPELQTQVATIYPDKAAAWLRTANLNGPILNEFGWGGYLEWTNPTIPFFIDTRADIFDQWGTLQDYIDAASIKRPFEVMDKYKIRYALFPRKDPIAYLLVHTPGWTIRYQDETAILFERDQPR